MLNSRCYALHICDCPEVVRKELKSGFAARQKGLAVYANGLI